MVVRFSVLVFYNKTKNKKNKLKNRKLKTKKIQESKFLPKIKLHPHPHTHTHTRPRAHTTQTPTTTHPHRHTHTQTHTPTHPHPHTHTHPTHPHCGSCCAKGPHCTMTSCRQAAARSDTRRSQSDQSRDQGFVALAVLNTKKDESMIFLRILRPWSS